MSHFLDRLTHFSQPRETFSNGHGVATGEDRTWEDAYRDRWAHDKIVRSTHGVNCTGSCSWKIYVKGGIVTWETQQTDYPRTRWDLPNHEPRGCARRQLQLVPVQRQPRQIPDGARPPAESTGARRAWPRIRCRCLGEHRRGRRQTARLPEVRGLGGFVRSSWDEVNEIVAAANVYTIKKYMARPRDRLLADSGHVDGQLRRRLALPEPDRRRVHELLRLVLRPAALQPADLGRADRRARVGRLVQLTYIIAWGSNVPQTRTPDAHFFTEVRYKGAKTVAVTPDYAEISKLATCGCTPNRAPTRRWRWRWAT